MRRVLLDENLPRKLRRELSEFVVRTVQEEGWTSLANGELLGQAQHSFDVLLTADRRLQFQQNVPRFDIGVVVIVTPSLRYRTIKTAVESIRTALKAVMPGEVTQVQVPERPPIRRRDAAGPAAGTAAFRVISPRSTAPASRP